VFIDDQVVVTATCCSPTTGTYTVPAGTSTTKRIRIDYVETGGPGSLVVEWNASGSWATIPASVLAPAYGLATRTTVEDTTSPNAPSIVTHTRYDQNGWDPGYGLVTSTIVDPAGAALTTSVNYDTSLRRRITRTLPAGNTTTTTYWGNTETSTTVTCADGTTIAGGVNQAGLPKTITAPTGANGTAVTTTTVYDLLGRPIASRYGTDSIWSCTAFDARGRVTKTTIPANATNSARTVRTYFWDTYSPDTTYRVDSVGSIITVNDYLGRPVGYTDTLGAAYTTTTVYDTAGRVARRYGATIGATATSAGLEYSYDRGGFVTQVRLDGEPIANPIYTAGVLGGELSAVSYPNGTGNAGNGTSGSITRNNTGAVTGLSWTAPGGALITSNTVTRTQSGRVIDETIDGVDPDTSGGNQTYDTAGRLTAARAGNGTIYQYAYTPGGGCGANTAAGKNSNRTSATIGGVLAANFCYDNADRLTSVTNTTGAYSAYTGAITYDPHGNTLTLAGETHTYDHTNRHLGTTSPATGNSTAIVEYVRDLDNNIVARNAYTTTTPGDVAQLLTPAERSFATSPPGSWTGGTITNGTYTDSDPIEAIMSIDKPATPGRVYTASIQVADTSFDATRLAIEFYNGTTWLASTSTQNYEGILGLYTVTATAPANTTMIRMMAYGGTWEYNQATLTIANPSLITHNPATTTAENHRYTQGATLDTYGNIIERTITLPGGVNLTKRTTGDVWAYPNIHGDTQATTNNAGVKQGGTRTYDPYGTPLAGYPDTTTGNTDNTWLGQHNKRTEHLPGLQPTIQLGARPYNPTLGRFTQTDPVEDGNNNTNTYPNDPTNMNDLDGQCGTFGNPFKKCKDKNRKDQGFLGGVFSKSGRAVGTIAKKTYDGAVYLGNHLGTGVTACTYVCVGFGFKGGRWYTTTGGHGLGASIDLQAFQGPLCSQAGWGAFTSVSSTVFGGESSVSLNDDGTVVPGSNGIGLAAGLRIGMPFAGGTTHTRIAGCS
jgi:RHS repeat-associated protein